MLKASIDIGSNSTLLLIAAYENNEFDVKVSESRVTGLGRELDKNSTFIQEAMDDTYEALSEYKKILSDYGIAAEDVDATAIVSS